MQSRTRSGKQFKNPSALSVPTRKATAPKNRIADNNSVIKEEGQKDSKTIAGTYSQISAPIMMNGHSCHDNSAAASSISTDVVNLGKTEYKGECVQSLAMPDQQSMTQLPTHLQERILCNKLAALEKKRKRTIKACESVGENSHLTSVRVRSLPLGYQPHFTKLQHQPAFYNSNPKIAGSELDPLTQRKIEHNRLQALEKLRARQQSYVRNSSLPHTKHQQCHGAPSNSGDHPHNAAPCMGSPPQLRPATRPFDVGVYFTYNSKGGTDHLIEYPAVADHRSNADSTQRY